jgi:hypothetical protein
VIIHPQVNSVRAIADPDRPLEQELASRDLEQHRHYRISRQPLGWLQQLQRAFGLELRRRPTAGWAQGPGQGGTIGPRQAVVPNGGQENKGIRAAAGGSLPALNPVKGAITHQRGEVSKDAPKNEGPLTVPSDSSQGTHPRDPARSRRPVPAEGLQGGAAGLAVAAVASSPLVTGAVGRCPLHIPFGISTVRESQMQAPIDRSRQAG